MKKVSNAGRKIQHVVITGASSGLGEALAQYYAGADITLILTGRNEERLEKVAQNCRAKGAVVNSALICVTDRQAMKEWLLKVDNEKSIDLIIANAGISAGTGGSKTGEDPEQVRNIFAVNLDGVLNTIEPVLPKMLERGFGHIALMSSLGSFRGFPGAPAYCASKAAIRVYGEGLRGSLSQSGICVHVICPGFVKSRITDTNDFPMPLLMSAEKAAKIIATGITKNRGRIAFPFPTYFFAWLLGVMPDVIAQMLTNKAPSKSTALK